MLLPCLDQPQLFIREMNWNAKNSSDLYISIMGDIIKAHESLCNQHQNSLWTIISMLAFREDVWKQVAMHNSHFPRWSWSLNPILRPPSNFFSLWNRMDLMDSVWPVRSGSSLETACVVITQEIVNYTSYSPWKTSAGLGPTGARLSMHLCY